VASPFGVVLFVFVVLSPVSSMAEPTVGTDGCSRRSFLRAGATAGALGLSTSLSGCIGIFLGGGYYQQRRRRRQARAGSPVSFASHRDRVRRSQATHIARARSQLTSAVGESEATIWIPGDATIDMTGASQVEIADNVTIASNRNLNGGTGGLIRTTDQQNVGVFTTKHEDVSFRVTGVRLKGSRTDRFDPREHGRSEYDFAVTGFRAYGQSVIVDNCEVFGWTSAGFIPGTKSTPTRGWFHHNAMHHNRMEHLGYPMDLYNGEHLIEWNYFDYNRHSIAGFGRRKNGYEARFNVVGPHSIQHAFDMHYLGENLGTSNRMAGTFTNVHHNVFELTSDSAFSIQGRPRQYARFCRNWCAAPKGGADHGDNEGVVFAPDYADVRVKHNRYDTVTPGHRWLRQLSRQLDQRPDVLAPRPSPSPLSITLPIQSSPSLPGSADSSTTAPNQPTTPMLSTPSSTTTPTSRINPITNTPLTPVGGER
jgi:hypothetical protein